MNYSKLYCDYLEFLKNNNIKERLEMKPYDDKRKYDSNVYTEVHHILPKSLGGKNNPENLIQLLPEEHLKCHWLRYKAIGDKEDFLAVRMMLNTKFLSQKFESFHKKKFLELPEEVVSDSFLKIYHEYRDEIYNFRKTQGWQTEEGRKRISEAKKGKTPCVDANTGEKIGSVDVNHPKILSGEWVHCTKGWTSAIDLETGGQVRVKAGQIDGIKYKSIICSEGEKNVRFNKDFYKTFDEFIKDAEEFFKEIKLIVSENIILKLKKDGYKHPFIQKFVKSDYRKKVFGIASYNDEFKKIKHIPSAVSKSGLPLEYKKLYSVSKVEDYVKIKLKELKYA